MNNLEHTHILIMMVINLKILKKNSDEIYTHFLKGKFFFLKYRGNELKNSFNQKLINNLSIFFIDQNSKIIFEKNRALSF